MKTKLFIIFGICFLGFLTGCSTSGCASCGCSGPSCGYYDYNSQCGEPSCTDNTYLNDENPCPGPYTCYVDP